ncbi:hypothetical protein PYCC9005_001664 [Savitreella phatthalungensis]
MTTMLLPTTLMPTAEDLMYPEHLPSCPDSPLATATSRGRSSTLQTGGLSSSAATVYSHPQLLTSASKENVHGHHGGLRRMSSAIKRVSMDVKRSSAAHRHSASIDALKGRPHIGADGKYVAPPPLEPPSLHAARLAWVGFGSHARKHSKQLSVSESYAPLQSRGAQFGTITRSDSLGSRRDDALYHGVHADAIRGSGYSRYPTTHPRTTLRVEDQRVKGFRALWRELVLSIRLKLYRFKRDVFKTA